VEVEAKANVTNKGPKKAQKKSGGNLEQRDHATLPSALKGKRNLFCFDDTGARTYVVDSGASFHVVSRSEMTERELQTITQLKQPIHIQTANGPLELTENCQIYVKDLKAHLCAYILEDTVSLLSLGLLVEELGYSYIWNPRCSPVLRKGNITVHCHPTHHVPHIYLGILTEDAAVEVKSRSLPPSEHPDADQDESKGQPELKESSPGEGHDDKEQGGPSSAASLV